MKILFIDFDIQGHHGIYIRTLIGLTSEDSVLVLPRKAEGFVENRYCITEFGRNMGFTQYMNVLRELRRITCIEKPDAIHVLSGDFLYRFFGLGLGLLPKPLLVTFHHMIFSKIRLISYKLIFRKISCGVVHTEYINDQLINIGIKNSLKIEYPCFENVLDADVMLLKDKYGIPGSGKVLLAFGGTRYDKGLDILLKALKGVEQSFHLVVAGKAEDFTEKFICDQISEYKDKVSCYLTYIDETMMEELFALCDIVVLPYRRKFAGASGPLTTGVANGKMIIGPDYNSIGQIIVNNHLGEVFHVEEIDSLQKAIVRALNINFEYDNVALQYKESITKRHFTDEYKELYRSVVG